MPYALRPNSAHPLNTELIRSGAYLPAENNKRGRDWDMVSEVDQFDILEQKIESLIRAVTVLRKEKEALAEKAQIQEEKLADLGAQVEELRNGRDKAKQRIIRLLEKLEQITA
jgi:septal ring factor EnvC (AmiA/AmiB activator)